MTVGISGFAGRRLVQAREARGLTSTGLSEIVGVSPAAISQYERGGQSPRPEVLNRLAIVLNEPPGYFLRPAPPPKDRAIFYRSMSAATKRARARGERKYEWLIEIVSYLEGFFDFPELRLPDLEVPDDFRKITSLQIETFANQTREFWNLGVGPIMNMVRTLESNGFIVARGNMDAETLDAFSEFEIGTRPIVFLGADKNIFVRSRFDAAHELAHILFHRNMDRKTIRRSHDFRLIENQAHHFANAFLLPARSFNNELVTISLDSFRTLKMRWKISIAAMIHRCQELDLVTKEEAKRLWINLNRRGWREFEPMDDLEVERPQLIAKCFEMLVQERVKTREQILDDLMFADADIEELASLPKNFFADDKSGNELSPQLKNEKIIPFRRDVD